MKKRSPTPPIAVALAAILATGHPVAGSTIDQRCLSALTQDGPPAWKEVASFVKDISVDFQQRRVDTQEGPKPTVTKINADWSLCWDRSASRRLLDRRDPDSGRRNLVVVNPRYRFELSRLREQDSFKLESGKRFSPGSPQRYDITENQYRTLLEAGITVQFLTLPEILADKEFRLTRAEFVPDANAPDRRALIAWDYLGTEGRARSRHAGGIYWVELDPKESWQILRGGVRIPSTGEEWSKEVTYQPTDGHVPFPETVKVSLSMPRSKYKFDIVYTLGKPSPCKRSEAEYFLPYYGIPESALGYPDASAWPRILGIGAGVLGLGVGLFAFSRIRRNRAEPDH